MSRRLPWIIGALLGMLMLILVATIAMRSRPPVVAQQATSTPAPALTATLSAQNTSTPLATSTPTSVPTQLPPRSRLPYTPVPDTALPPVVVERSPDRGEEAQPDAPVRLAFDRAMDRGAVAAALSVSPKTGGRIEWPDDRTVLFRPDAPWKRDAVYDVTLDQRAKARDGAQINGAYQFRFATGGYLEVAQVIPAASTQDAQAATTITLIFNRPVVPLQTVSGGAALPQPLRLFARGGDAPVPGTGEWLNTSVYVFRPDQALLGGTVYTGRVDRALQGTDGSPLKDEYTWQFGVATPQVLSTAPQRGATGVKIEAPIQAQLNQPVSPAGARAAFRLTDGGAAVAGQAGALGQTLLFTPTQRLRFDTEYTAEIAGGLTGAGGGAGLAQPFRWTFRTVPLPRVVSTTPADGDKAARAADPFMIKFNAPIDPATVMLNLQITPPFTPTEVFTGYNDYDHSFYLQFGARPSTDYQVRIGPNIADPYGNRTGQTVAVRFRTAMLPPDVRLLVPDMGTYSAAEPARLLLSSVNAPRAELSLYRLPKDVVLGSAGDWYNTPPPASQRMRRWSVTLQRPLDQTVTTPVDLVEGGGKLDPGVYLLTLDNFPDTWPRVHMLVVSELNLTLKSGQREALVWANRLADGQPVASLGLSVYSGNRARLGSATTDASGVARISFDPPGDPTLIVLADRPFAAAASSWAGGISPYEFGIQQGYGAASRRIAVYTDRPIYRPGQQVRYKGVVRDERDVRYSLPGNRSVTVAVQKPNGERFGQQTLQLNAMGAFSGDLTLPPEAEVGTYMLLVDPDTASGGAGQFTVAAYRPPELEIAVKPAAKEIVRGAASSAAVEARYFFGAPLAGAALRWNVLAEPYRFAPSGLERYSFADDDQPWRCIECWSQPQRPPTPIMTGTTTADTSGKINIAIPADLRWGDGKPITQSVTLTIEATASGKDNQVISGRDTLVAHQAAVYVGLAARSYVQQAGQEAAVDLITTGVDGARRAGQTVDVEIVRSEWTNRFVPTANGGRWESTERRTPVARQSVATDSRGETIVTFTPDKGGAYRVIARASDGARTAQSSLFVWVAGADTVWLRSDEPRVNLVADRTRYAPGDSASILIPSPFTGPTWALVTIERGSILRHEVIKLVGAGTVYTLPISAEHAPNIFVSVVLVTGPDEGRRYADFKVGMLPLAVDPVPQTLKVTLTPNAPTVAPGDKASYAVAVTDAAGRPVAAELSLDLVDKAVLSLMPREPDALRRAFYGRRELGIATATGLSISADRMREELQKRLAEMRRQGAGGGMGAAGGATAGGAAATTAAGAAEAVPAADRAGQVPAQQAPVVRANFADTAFWQASFATDARGRGRVSVALPDNLTTWVLRAEGVTAQTQVGEGTVEVVTTKPLLVRPVAPRFLVAGDAVEFAANVSNTTDRALAVDVVLSATGITTTSPLTQSVSIPARGEAKVRWQGTAGGGTEARLIFSARGGGLSDAATPRLASGPAGAIPIYRYSVAETVGTGGALTNPGARTEIVALPSSFDDRRGEVTLRLDPSLAAGMRDALEALDDDKDLGVEATVSSFLPNVVTYRALKNLGVSRPDLEQRLPGLIKTGVDRLRARQHQDGGWGWWEEPESNPHVSAYVVLGLLRAKEAGFGVDDTMMGRGRQYLTGKLVTVDERTNTTEANLQAFLLYVLGESGDDQAGPRAALVQYREKLSAYARALLAMAVARSNPDDRAGKALLSDLQNSAILSATGAHWEEDTRDWWSMNTDTRSTAIVLQALARLDPQNQLNPQVVRWLMVARQDGIWETRQESAWAIMALSDWMAHTGELKGSYDYTAWLNGAAQIAGRVDPSNVDQPATLPLAVGQLLRDAGNKLTVARGDGPGVLYYTAHLRAFLPAPEVRALDRGIHVRRRYTLASCADGPKCPTIAEAKVGDVLRAEVTLVAPHDLYYLRLEDPLPAGVEAVDTGLATTSMLAQGPELRRRAEQPERPGEPRPLDAFWTRWWSWYSRSELRDEKVVLWADQLGKGTYEYSYTLRATQPGTFQVIPTTANELYFPEVYGRGDGQVLTIK